MKKRWNLEGSTLCLIMVAVIIFGTLAALQYKFKFIGELPNPFELKPAQISTPSMPEVKSRPAIKSPILKKAFKLQVAGRQIKLLIKKLENKGIFIDKTGSIRDAIALAFLQELLADEKSQKIFREFSEAGITIFLDNKYVVLAGAVFINTNDGVKKTAKWLATGKI
ncbi:MAG: hypothetical protein Q8N42_01760 [bacterium]|nr:hypothetical protein [bacterium]